MSTSVSTQGMGTHQQHACSERIPENSLMAYSSILMSYPPDSIAFYLSISMSICLVSFSLVNCSL
jgi:hypothetical protein